MGAYQLIKGEDNNNIGGGGTIDNASSPNGNKVINKIEDGYTAKELEFLQNHLKNQHHQYHVLETTTAIHKNQSSRLVSLDVFRGLTVAEGSLGTWKMKRGDNADGSSFWFVIMVAVTPAFMSYRIFHLMILVDNAGGILPALNHSPWNGITPADFVFPLFLFIVGVSLGLTYKRLSCRAVATGKAVQRALKLLALGLILQGGYFHRLNDLSYGVDLQYIRWMGVLQRIAVAYLLTALCEIWLKGDDDAKSEFPLSNKYRLQWAVVGLLTVTYMVLLYGLRVPDWEYQIPSESSAGLKEFTVKCGVRGDTGPACNTVGMIDRQILGIQHLHKRPIYARTEQCSINSPDYGPLPHDAPSWCLAPFDPEGILSTAMAIVTCLIGLHYGHVIVHFKDHKDRILHWMIPSFCLVVTGFILDFFGMHLNKALYTPSYMCVTAGAAGILFAGTYVLVDVFGFRRPTIILEWMGVHSLMVYILAACNILPVFIQGFYWKKPENNILRLIGIGS